MDRYAKAIVGFFVAGLTTLAAAVADDNTVTYVEWIGVALAALGVLSGVYATSDTRSKAVQPQPPGDAVD